MKTRNIIVTAAALSMSLITLSMTACGSPDVTAATDGTYSAAVTESDTETKTSAASSTEIETSAQTAPTEEFVYPDGPLTAENLIKITEQAKKLIYKKEGIGQCTQIRFGLIDADFDGLPEIFCEKAYGGNASNYYHTLYSLKEENFCEMLLEYYACADLHPYSPDYWSIYMVNRKKGKKNIAVMTVKRRTLDVEHEIFEMDFSDGKPTFTPKLEDCLNGVYNPDDEQHYFSYSAPYCLRVNGVDVQPEEYERASLDYTSAGFYPADYVYEEITFPGHDDSETDAYVSNVVKENYDMLLGLYENYLNDINN